MAPKLTVTLKADDVLIAEVENPLLWQSVFTAILAGDTEVAVESLAGIQSAAALARAPQGGGRGGNEPLDKIAAEIGVDRAVVEGACSPTGAPPFMHLNTHNWEAMRKQLPVRGPTAMSPIVAVSTLLALWFRAAGLGSPTQAQALAVLAEINVEDKNPSRGVRRATWLIARSGGQIQLNAAEVSTAAKVAKAFCSKDWAEWAKGKAAE